MEACLAQNRDRAPGFAVHRSLFSEYSCGAHMEYAPVNKNQGTDDSDEKDLEVDPAPFASRLKSEHHDLCPWNGNACPAEFLHLPPMAADDLRSGEFVAVEVSYCQRFLLLW